METAPLQVYDLFNASLPIDYQLQGDRWIILLQEALTEEIPGVNGNGIGGNKPSAQFPYFHWDFRLNVNPNMNSNVTPGLVIVPVGNKSAKGVYLFLTSKTTLTQDDIVLWTKCIEKARLRLNEDNPTFTWTAVLVQGHSMTGLRYVFRKQTHLSSISIKSANKLFTMYEKGSMPSFNSSTVSISWPLVLGGKSKGYNWIVASQEAGQQIHKLAALLSLFQGVTWKLVQSPQQVELGKLVIPDSNEPSRSKVVSESMKKNYKEFPKWVIKVFDKIDNESILKHALNAYYQGLAMEEDHPSFSLIAFVAVIESVGKTIIGDECSCCGRKNGAKQKFKTGLSSVITDVTEVNRLTDIYSTRSDTAHEGILHGNEASLGSINMPSIFNATIADFFAYTDLLKIKNVARKSLISSIKKID